MSAISITKIKTWTLTWDRAGKPGKRTGNHFFSARRAREVYDQKKAAGQNPSEIKVEDKDWLCM